MGVLICCSVQHVRRWEGHSLNWNQVKPPKVPVHLKSIPLRLGCFSSTSTNQELNLDPRSCSWKAHSSRGNVWLELKHLLIIVPYISHSGDRRLWWSKHRECSVSSIPAPSPPGVIHLTSGIPLSALQATPWWMCSHINTSHLSPHPSRALN